VDELKAAFNHDHGRPRLIVLLSPYLSRVPRSSVKIHSGRDTTGVHGGEAFAHRRDETPLDDRDASIVRGAFRARDRSKSVAE
jgi:hypothetical protein